MTKYATTRDGGNTIDTVWMFDPKDPSVTVIQIPDDVFSGYTKQGSYWVAPAAGVPPVPLVIRRDQLIAGMVRFGFITGDEGVAFASGSAIPPELDAIISAMPSNQQAEARIFALTRDRVGRTDQIVLAAAAAHAPPLTDAQIDAFFIACAAI